MSSVAPGRFTIELRLAGDGVQDRRTLESDDCRELANAAVLIVALAADPTLLSRGGLVASPALDLEPQTPEPQTPEPQTPAAPTEARPGSPTSAPSSKRAPSRPPRDPLRIGARALAGVGLRVVPGPTAEVGVAVAIWRSRWRVELGASYWLPQTEPSRVRGQIQAWAIEPRACVLAIASAIEVPLCAGAQMGAVHGRALGVAVPRARASPWLAAALGAGLVWRPRMVRERRLGLWLRAEALPAVLQARFSTPEQGVIFTLPDVGARIGAGVEVRLR